MNVRSRRRTPSPVNPTKPMTWKIMKIKYVCQCVYCGTALGVGTDAYGKKSGLTGKWQFLCSHCFNNPDLPFIQEAAPPPKPTGESKEADENLAALFEATKAAIGGVLETSVPLPDGVTMADVQAMVMETMATGQTAEPDLSTLTTDEPLVQAEIKAEATPYEAEYDEAEIDRLSQVRDEADHQLQPEAVPEFDINNPPARLRSMKEIVDYAKYKIKWRTA